MLGALLATAAAAAVGSMFPGFRKGVGQLWNGITGQTAAKAQREANETNLAIAQTQMAREDTAHQREVTDLKAAGLNPWLSVSNGGSQVSALSTAKQEPEDGSKYLQATSALAMVAMTKILTKLL